MFDDHNVNRPRNPSALRAVCIATSFVGFLVIAACGSSGSSSPGAGSEAGATDGGGDGGRYTFTSCPSVGVTSAACTSCLETSCSEELSAVNTACAEYYACGCPIDGGGSSCSPSTSCAAALTALDDQCVSCDVCAGPISDGGGYSLTDCPAAGFAQACVSCLQTCSSTQLPAIDSACATFLSCVCPAGADASACTPSVDCELELATALVDCTSCGTPCGLTASDAGPTDAGSIEGASDVTAPPTDAGPDGTVASVEAGGPSDAASDAGDADAADAGDAAVAPGDASSDDAQADALGPQDAATGPADASPEAATPNDAESDDESEGGSGSDGG